MKDFRGRVAFVTGGGSGIGLGPARVLCEAVMKVGGRRRRRQAAAAVADALR